MKPLTLLFICAALAIGASALTTYLLRADVPSSAAHAARSPVRPASSEGELELRLASLERGIAELAARPAGVAPEGRYAPDELERVVRRMLAEERAAPAEASSAGGGPSQPAEADLPRASADLLALLEDPALAEVERQLLWERVRAAGRIDEVLASYEARAEADPNDPRAQVQLGNAYLQKLFQLGDGPLKGRVAMQADAAFDRALALDPANWEARFTKAISLSHWPPIFGKQAEAIGHFQILVEQQRIQPAQPHHVQTYLLLGNLYLQSGKLEEAQAVWKEGLGVFPGNPALLDALTGK